MERKGGISGYGRFVDSQVAGFAPASKSVARVLATVVFSREEEEAISVGIKHGSRRERHHFRDTDKLWRIHRFIVEFVPPPDKFQSKLWISIYPNVNN